MKTDAMLKSDIERELAWDPSINAAHVGVMVDDGVVTVTGHLDTYAQKDAVERAVARVQDVRAIAVELDVRLAPDHARSDSEIAHAAETALRWLVHVPADRIRIKVEKGWIWLDGELDWDYQRQAAIDAVRNMTGVVGLTSYMTLKPVAVPADVKQRIHDALARHAEREARHVEVSVVGSVARLRGRVDTLAVRDAVQGAAWSAPGIATVVNE